MEFATEQECIERRNEFINAGIIKSGTHTPTEKLENMTPQETREFLIANGTIKPVTCVDGKMIYCDLPPQKKYSNLNTEEGEYKVLPINTDEDYNRRKQVYFRMLQEVVTSRQELGLIINFEKENE
jgi:hypothetical protein